MHQLNNSATAGLQSLSTSLWTIYRCTYADIVTKVIFPERTRKAVFQLVCELRCNVPKDEEFVRKHKAALKPQTLVGWLAMATALAYSASAAGLVAAGFLVLLAGFVIVIVLSALFGGLTLAGIFVLLCFLALLAATGTCCIAAGLTCGFVFLSLINKCLEIAAAGVNSIVWSFTPAPQEVEAPAPAPPDPLPTSTRPTAGPAAPCRPPSPDALPIPKLPTPEAAAPWTPPSPEPLHISQLAARELVAAQAAAAEAAAATAAAAAAVAAAAAAAGDRLSKPPGDRLSKPPSLHVTAALSRQSSDASGPQRLSSHAAPRRPGTPTSSVSSRQHSPMSSTGTDYDTVRRFFEETSSAACGQSVRPLTPLRPSPCGSSDQFLTPHRTPLPLSTKSSPRHFWGLGSPQVQQQSRDPAATVVMLGYRNP